jgi:hypothetical protein
MRTAFIRADENDLISITRLCSVVFLVLLNLSPPAGIQWLMMTGDPMGLAHLFADEVRRYGMALFGTGVAYMILSLGLPGLTAALVRAIQSLLLPLLAWTVAHLFL